MFYALTPWTLTHPNACTVTRGRGVSNAVRPTIAVRNFVRDVMKTSSSSPRQSSLYQRTTMHSGMVRPRCTPGIDLDSFNPRFSCRPVHRVVGPSDAMPSSPSGFQGCIGARQVRYISWVSVRILWSSPNPVTDDNSTR